MARLLLPVSLILLLAIHSTTSSRFSCPNDLSCNCFASGKNEYNIHCLTNSTTNSAFDITIQPAEGVARIECANSPDWSRLFRGGAVVGRPGIDKFVFASCAPPGPMYSARIAKWQINTENVEYLKYEDLKAPLSAQDLEVFPDVKHLVLTNNPLGEMGVQPDLLRGLPRLKILELRRTNIQIPQGFFDRSSFLKTLELSGNNLKSLAPGVFDGLKRIELLNLWKNDFQELNPEVFRNLRSLVVLDIHQNNLKTLPVNVFADLKNLEIINFSINNFTSLPADLFVYNPKLRIVKLSYNKGNLTTLPARLLANFADLQVVSLMRSGILYLPEDLFWGSTSIIELNLSRNFLRTLPLNLLKDAAELQTFSLSFNDLRNLDAQTFSSNKKLVKLDLSKNHLTSIGKYTFAGLESLEELNIEDNNLSYIHVDAFASLEQLRIARFANNKLTLRTNIFDPFGQLSPLHPCSLLEELDLTNNNISEIFSDWIIGGAKLQKLDLSYNNFKSLQAEDLRFTSDDIKVDLSHNNIRHVNLAHLEYMPDIDEYRRSRQASVLLSSNPIQCDCKIYDLVRYLTNQMNIPTQARVKLNIEDMVCEGPEYMSGLLVAQLNSRTIKCPATPCTSDSSCDCWMRPSDHTLLLDCAGRNLTTPPTWIDSRGAERVELDLSMNELRTGPNMSAKGYNKVVSLNLADNKIAAVEESLIAPNLNILNLNGNKLTSMKTEVLKRMSKGSNISQLTLSNNPWSCDCSSRDMLYFIRMDYSERFSDFLNINCRNLKMSLSSVSIDELCSPALNRFLLMLCLFIGFFSVGLLMGFAVIYVMPDFVRSLKKDSTVSVVPEKQIQQIKVTFVDEITKNQTVAETVGC